MASPARPCSISAAPSRMNTDAGALGQGDHSRQCAFGIGEPAQHEISEAEVFERGAVPRGCRKRVLEGGTARSASPSARCVSPSQVQRFRIARRAPQNVFAERPCARGRALAQELVSLLQFPVRRCGHGACRSGIMVVAVRRKL